MAYKNLNKIVCGKYTAALANRGRPFSAGNMLSVDVQIFPHSSYSTTNKITKKLEDHAGYRSMEYKKPSGKPDAIARDHSLHNDGQERLNSKIPLVHRAIDDIILNYNGRTENDPRLNLQYQRAMNRLPQVRVSAKGTRHQFIPPERSDSVLAMIKKDLLTTNLTKKPLSHHIPANSAHHIPLNSAHHIPSNSFSSPNLHSRTEYLDHSKFLVKENVNKGVLKGSSKGPKKDLLKDINEENLFTKEAPRPPSVESKRKITVRTYNNAMKRSPLAFRLKRDVIHPDVNEMNLRHQIQYIQPMVTKKRAFN